MAEKRGVVLSRDILVTVWLRKNYDNFFNIKYYISDNYLISIFFRFLNLNPKVFVVIFSGKITTQSRKFATKL